MRHSWAWLLENTRVQQTLYKRIEAGRLQWPRTEEEVLSISQEDFSLLMQGFSIVQKSTIREPQCTEIA